MNSRTRDAGLDADSLAYAHRNGPLCARVRWTWPQILASVVAISALVALAAFALPWAWILISTVIALLSAATLGLRLLAISCTAIRDPTIHLDADLLNACDRQSLPLYCILVPLYREPEVVPRLIIALASLDYPADRLDIRFLLEPDDDTTTAALAGQELPAHMRIVTAPVGQPRTKPRACNAGLAGTEAELLVIYDAEDRPEPDQLLMAALAYRSVPDDVVCLQCRLDHYNSQQSMPARWTSIDYLVWFRLVLPGLQRLGAPIPLGGTSNHFRVAALRELGGWDPFNVTEDCDLGMRIARRGWKTRMLASTTWEEAVATIPAWVHQRSRWIKGYLQTWMVHSRCRPLRAFGLRGTVLMCLGTLGLVGALLVNPIAWATVLLWLAIGWSVVDTTSPLSIATLVITIGLFLANLMMIGIAITTCLRQGRRDLVAAATLTPIAWVLQSLAAWRAAREYLTRPFHWQKTSHGLAIPDALVGGRRVGVALTALAAMLLLGLVGLAGWRVGDDIKHQAEARRPPPPPVQLPLRFVGPDEHATGLISPDRDRSGTPWRLVPAAEAPECGIEPVAVQADASFPLSHLDLVSHASRDLAGVAAVALDVQVPIDAPVDLRVSLHWIAEDDEWFGTVTPQRLVPGQWTRLEFSLQEPGSWLPGPHRRALHMDLLRGVRELGLSFFSALDYQGSVTVANLRTIPLPVRTAPAAAIAVQSSTAPQVMQPWRLAITLDQSWTNPYDPTVVALDCVITGPSGTEHRIPGFYSQDYARRLDHDQEVLDAIGPPGWQIRYRAREAGEHRWRLLLSDQGSPAREVAAGTFTATAGAHPGYIRRSEAKPEFLAHEDGSFYYPIGQNLCHAIDLVPPLAYSFAIPPDQGSYTFDRYFNRMAEAGMNAARIWMTPWSYGLEGKSTWYRYHGAGRYNLASAWKLDHLLDEGERLGIDVLLTINHMSEFNSEWTSKAWRDSALNKANGGCLRQPEDFFTSPEVMRLYRQRLRYIVARWGDRPGILAWEFFGEANLMPGFVPDDCAEWHRQLAAYVRELDQDRHLIFTHTHNWQKGHELWRLADIDCIQGNGYIRPPNHSTNHVENFDRYLAEVSHYRKPVLVAEFGGRSELGAPSEDYLIGQLHSGIWASFMRPFAGVALHWWWNFVDGADLYPHYRGLTAFAVGIDRLARNHRPVQLLVQAGVPLLAAGMQDQDSGFYWVCHPALFESWAQVPNVAGARLVLNDLAAGTYQVEFWDTLTGTISESRSLTIKGPTTLELPPIHRDLAFKIFPLIKADGTGAKPPTQ